MTKSIEDTNEVKKMIGSRLRKAREKKGETFSRKVIVDLLNAHPKAPSFKARKVLQEGTYKKWETAENAIQLEWIPAICAVLDCDVGYLFGSYPENRREVSDVHAVTGLEASNANYLIMLQTVIKENPYSSYRHKFYLDTVNSLLKSKLFWDAVELLRQAYIIKNRLAFDGFAPPYPNEEEIGDNNEDIVALKKEFNDFAYFGVTDDFMVSRDEMKMVYLRRAGDRLNDLINFIIEGETDNGKEK